jgi:hypothetical protein
MKSANCSGSTKSIEILFNVQPTLPSKNKIVPNLSEHDCTYHFAILDIISIGFVKKCFFLIIIGAKNEKYLIIN